MNNRLLPVVAVLVLVLASCGRSTAPTSVVPLSTSVADPKKDVPPPDLTPRSYPSVDGSTSTHPLQVLVACQFLDVPCDWQEPWPFEATRRIGPDLGYEGNPRAVERIFEIRHSGTHGAYVNLIEGETDIILVARLPSEDELQAARDKGVVLDTMAVALDAFVFLVHVDNEVDVLELETIREIYAGGISSWADVMAGAGQGGEADQEMHPYQRNRNSGSQELMEALVMQGTPMVNAPNMLLESMMGPINAIGSDLLGIGYSVYFYATFINPGEKIKLIGVDGVLPTSETIADRSYPLTTEVYAVIREGAPRKSGAVELCDWLLTREGQTVVERSGYVPVR
jgi:phosphate transport system substrate-binding protein